MKPEVAGGRGGGFWGIMSVDDGLALLRLNGLRILCWALLLTMPILIVRDLFASGLGASGVIAGAIMGIRGALIAMSVYVLWHITQGTPERLKPVPIAHATFAILVVMVVLTVIKLGGAESPVYAGLVTVMAGWCYFFAFGLKTTVPFFISVVVAYLAGLWLFLGESEMTSEAAILRAALLGAAGLFVSVAGSAYLREQERRFEAIIRQKEVAGHDSLTGLLNRFALRDRYEAALDRAKRYNRSLSVLVLDIDDFKKINDSNGHSVGDEVLRALGALLGARVAAIGHVGRWGGEEFVVVLPGTSRGVATSFAEDFCDEFAATDIAFPAGSLRAAVSVGVSSLDRRDVDEAQLFTEADQALYKAKAQGKNQVCAELLERTAPEMQKAGRPFRDEGIRPLAPEEETSWLRELTYSGYENLALWSAAVVTVMALVESSLDLGEATLLADLSFGETCGLLVGALALTYVVARFRVGIILILLFHVLVPVCVTLLVAELCVATGGSQSPAYVLVMAVMVISSFTSPGGWRLGLPIFLAISMVWPLVMVAVGDIESTRSMVIRITILDVMGIVCILAHNLFHRIRREVVRLDHHLERMSTTDSLTGAENRRAFDARLDHECSLAIRDEAPLTLILVDVNRLKHINDRFGHLVGDQALLKLVAVMRSYVRSSDIVARLGGDEFALILPETDIAGAINLMERIDKQLDVERLSVPNREVEVTAACGLSELLSSEGGAEVERTNLLERADAALYAAKQEKGVCIGVHDGVEVRLVQIWSDGEPALR